MTEVPQRGPWAEVEIRGRTLYGQFGLQLSNAFVRRFVAECVLHSPYPGPKNCSDLHEYHDPPRPRQGGHVGQGGHVLTLAHPWLRYCQCSPSGKFWGLPHCVCVHEGGNVMTMHGSRLVSTTSNIKICETGNERVTA